MKVLLMHPDRESDLTAMPPLQAADVIADLGLRGIIATMANGDSYRSRVATAEMFTPQTDPRVIAYRHGALRDCRAHRDTITALYGLAGDVEREVRKHLFLTWNGMTPEQATHRSLAVLEIACDALDSLLALALRDRSEFTSPAFRRFFDDVTTTVDGNYLNSLRRHLNELRFEHGAVLSASLSSGLRGADYRLRVPAGRRLRDRLRIDSSGPGFEIDEHDVSGSMALTEIRSRGMHAVSGLLSTAANHLETFFATLRWELAFYLGSAALFDALDAVGGRACLPVPAPLDTRTFRCTDLYDAGLALHTGAAPVGNDLDAGSSNLVIVTGANRGGKSTFLRSVGIAQMLMQAGLPVPAREFAADVRCGVFTHFKREEDETLRSGKFDEELQRMSELVDHLPDASAVLFNESFAATNEQEGSAIAADIVRALLGHGHRVFYVTHMHELARTFYEARTGVFLRAERDASRQRSFRLSYAEPLPTSYGLDLYEKIFGEPAGPL
ncbi:MutS-related protein [Jongsikchunia kroppenstedtii]|uniref:MutS-related protein n=1 Tax=Jongsikchunia kroppenstedtii TaxID=1121721 RepID=UPI000375C119|nr:hypothetical protein [Jongsikchunia kroppenstedtii]